MESNINTVPNFRTQILECKSCGADFVLTEQEMVFYYRKNLSFPVRCRECRQQRKAQNASPTTTNQDGGLK